MNNSSLFLINKDLHSLLLPKKAFVDTNAVLEIFLNRKHKNDWLDFFVRGAEEGTEFIYTLHSLGEIRNVLNVQVHKKRADELGFTGFRGTPAWKKLENSTKYNFSKEVTVEVSKVKQFLDSAGFTFKTVENDESMFELENLYAEKYDLGPGDATIAAQMDKLGVNSLCSNDAGFLKTDNLNVYIPTKKAWELAGSRSDEIKAYKSLLTLKD
ncbi:type II toxin-antitoxin system VapC family toxin [Bacillus tropicus]|uniref:type II toxin-antitoxin system VapC family toxin n=1 Tax=Bacillus tropicus TaxID=2026188 RepID=UPI003D9A256E